MIAAQKSVRRRSPLVYSAGLASLTPPASGPMVVSSRRRPRRGSVWIPRQTPLVGTAYHLYANTGIGDPIDYASPIATVLPPALGDVTPTLRYPGTWSFGVRAFDLATGLEEENLEAAVTIVLDADGNDITNRPGPPVALRAFALAGGAVRVEWSYAGAGVNPSRLPTGFHVYIAPVSGPLAPVTPIRGDGRPRAGSGSAWLASGVGSPATPRRPASGSQRWTAAVGGSPNYTIPAATVSYSSAIANTFVANLAPQTGGVTYAIGVRAYNAAGEETNNNTVTATADSVGPAAVQSLTAASV